MPSPPPLGIPSPMQPPPVELWPEVAVAVTPQAPPVVLWSVVAVPAASSTVLDVSFSGFSNVSVIR